MLSKHAKLETAIVEVFVPQFVPNAKLIFLRGMEKKPLVFDEIIFGKLGVSTPEVAKLPDVVLYESKKKLLLLIEAVTAKDFISPNRRSGLGKLFEQCKAKKVYINAFWNHAVYSNNVDKLAWETEVWLAEIPSHMIHLNGDKFLKPR